EKKERKRRVLDEEERKELREWRAERRERLRDRFGRGAEGERRQQPSLMTHLAGAVASAAVAGLMARVRDKVMGRKAPEATERPEGVFTSTESFEHRYVA